MKQGEVMSEKEAKAELKADIVEMFDSIIDLGKLEIEEIGELDSDE